MLAQHELLLGVRDGPEAFRHLSLRGRSGARGDLVRCLPLLLLKDLVSLMDLKPHHREAPAFLLQRGLLH